MTRELVVSVLVLACAAPAFGADANAGKTVFRAQCALCHTAEQGDDGGAQGPALTGIFGARAASNSQFTYTEALRKSNLTWDGPTLERFLASPTSVVPGSSMVVSVPNAEDRENLVAYFRALREGTFKPAPPRAFGPPSGFPPPPAAPAPVGEADWKKDAPGRVHRIDPAKLPAPFDTPSARNFPRVVPPPPDAKLSVPPGFQVNVFAEGLQGPRDMLVASNGDVFVSETQAGRVKVMRPSEDGRTAARIEVFAQGLLQPFGLAFYPNDQQPEWLYVAETNRVVRYAYRTGDLQATAVPEVVVPQLTPVPGGHFTRDIAFSLDGKRMFVSVGSLSNVAEDLPAKTPEEIREWEAERGLGALWGRETRRAAVLVFDVPDPGPGKIFATGIRNCVGLTVQPATGELWCTTNERDGLGDDLVPDYSTRVKEGAFYGWPWYYIGSHEDPRHKGARPDLRGKATVPDVLFTAHSAADNLVFYPVNAGRSAFPKEYVGEGFAVLHGSWNRSFRTGHKIVRVRMKDNIPTGEYEDFLTGFIVDDGNAWARPVAATVAKDGSLLMSEDGNNRIYRIAYLQDANAEPTAQRSEIIIPGERVFPESLTSTSDGSIIMGSVGARTIFRARPGEGTAEAWIQPGTGGLQSIFGVLADERSGTLWACSGSFGPAGRAPQPAVLHAFDLKSGAPKARYPLPTPGAACNDIAVAADGTVYATDTTNMEVVRLKPGAAALEVWAGNGAFGPKGGVLDGIAIVDGNVVVNALVTGKLFSVAVNADGSAGKVVELKLDRPIERPDGMRTFGRGVLLVESGGGGRLTRVEIEGDSGKVTTLKEGFPDGPVSVTVVDETAWVLEGQLMALFRPDPNAQPKPFHAVAVPVGKP